jgi:hypothetical protein
MKCVGWADKGSPTFFPAIALGFIAFCPTYRTCTNLRSKSQKPGESGSYISFLFYWIKMNITNPALVAIAFLWVIAIPPTLSASETDNTTIVARVYGAPINLDDIQPSKEIRDRRRKELPEEKYLSFEKDFKRRQLMLKIILPLQDAFMKQLNNEPSEKEIQSHIHFLERADHDRMNDFQEQRKNILAELDSMDLSDKKRKSLTEHLNTLDSLIAQEQRKQDIARSIPNYDEIARQSRRKVSEHSVRNWKYNQTLFRVYGGRIIFQQAGLEPIDAYAAIMKHWRNTKAFEILDPAYADIFDEYDRYLEMPHTYLKDKDSSEYFDKPWWENKITP